MVFWKTSEEGNRFPVGELPALSPPDLEKNVFKLLLTLGAYPGLGFKFQVLNPSHNFLKQYAIGVMESQALQQLLQLFPGTR